MVLTGIVAGIIGAFFGLIIACLIRTAGDADEDAWRAWVDHMLAQEADGSDAEARTAPTGSTIMGMNAPQGWFGEDSNA